MPLLLLGGAGIPEADGFYIEIGFASKASTAQASITWTDVTSDVLVKHGVSIRRGRSTELDTFQAGTAQFSLKNTGRKYDPQYSAGPHYGDLLPLRPVRIRYVLSGASYPLFTGYVEGWPQAYEYPHYSEVRITCVDAFRLLEQADVTTGFFTLDSPTLGVLDTDRLGGGMIDAQLSGARVGTILDLVSFPTADRAVDTGEATISSADLAGSALSLLQSVESGEVGQFYVSPSGQVVFEQRHHRISETRSNTSQATYGDAGSEIPYSDISYDYSDKLIKNVISRTDQDDDTNVGAASDPTSIDVYFRRADAKTVPIADHNDLVAQAEAVLARYKDPQFRVDTVELRKAYPGTAAFTALVAARISDRVTVKRRPQSVGSAISQDLWIEGIEIDHRSTNDWTWRLFLSPVDPQAWFILDSASAGVLDTNQLAA